MQKNKPKKSLVVKIGSYFVFAIAMIICIVMFLPQGSLSNGDSNNGNVYATVDGDKIYNMEYYRFRNIYYHRIKDLKPYMERSILDNLIQKKVMVKLAKSLGITVSKNAVRNYVSKIFKDENGKYSEDQFKGFMNQHRFSLIEAYSFFEEDLIVQELQLLMASSIGVSKDEIDFENLKNSSSLQIKYAFFPKEELKKLYKKEIQVTDAEIEEEIKNNPEEAKDPKKDKPRIKSKLENKKLEAKKKEFIEKIDKLAVEKGSFSKVISFLKVKPEVSAKFKIGETVKESKKNGRPLYSLSDSDVFREQYLLLNSGDSSKAIDTYRGIYVFTPIKKDINATKLDEKQKETFENSLLGLKNRAIANSFIESYKKKIKIVRLVNFDKK